MGQKRRKGVCEEARRQQVAQIDKQILSLKRPHGEGVFKRRARWTGYQWAILLLISSASTLSFIDRINISIVNPVWIMHYHLSGAQAGFVLSIFSWTYALGLLFAGPMAMRWHQKHVLPLGMVLWTAATWLTALMFSVPLFTIARSLLGIGESTLIPSNMRIAAEIFDRADRTKAVSAFFAGGQLGPAIGAPIAAFVLTRLGWQAVFLVTGAFSIIWLLLWLPVYRPDKGVIAEDDEASSEGERPQSAQWLSLLKHRKTWALMIGQFGLLYMLYVYVTWLPSILVLQHHIGILSAGWFTSLIFLVNACMMVISGWVADFWLQRGGNLTLVRKTFCCGGMSLATIGIVAAAYVQNPLMTITMFILAICGLGMATPSSTILPIDMVPRHTVASLFGIATFFGNIGAAIAPLLTGLVYGWTGGFQIALLLTGAVTLVCGVGGFGLLLGKVEKFGQSDTRVVQEALQ